PGGSHANQYSYTLPDGPRGAGNIEVTVVADGNNNLFEYNVANTAEANNSAVVTTTASLAAYSDLQVANLRTEPASGIVSGSIVTVRWDDANAGTGATSGSWTDSIRVVNTATNETLVAANVPYDPSAQGTGAVPASDSRGRQYSFRLPEGNRGAGALQITVTDDTFNNLFEYNASGTAETNNVATATFGSALAAYTDLQISNLAIAPAANVQSGSTLQITWYDSNTANLAASSS